MVMFSMAPEGAKVPVGSCRVRDDAGHILGSGTGLRVNDF